MEARWVAAWGAMTSNRLRPSIVPLSGMSSGWRTILATPGSKSANWVSVATTARSATLWCCAQPWTARMG